MNPNDTSARPDTPGVDRREFLRVSGALAAGGALLSAGCQVPQEATVPFHDMPENLVDGIGPARFFHTVIDGTPVAVKTREGRPVLITPRADDASGRGLTVRHQASLMDLYDPDRARGPVSVRRGGGALVESSWAGLSPDVVSRLKAAGPKAVLLTGPVASPAVADAIAGITGRTGARHVVWAPLEADAAPEAWKLAFGNARVARPRLEKADLIVGLGAEFMDRPGDGLERDFALRRSPDQADGVRMSRFVQFEGRLTLTGANADRRIRVRDSHLGRIAAALAHELIVVRKLGPLASDPEAGKALAAFAIDAVAVQAGLDARVLKAVADELAAAPGRSIVIAGGSACASASGPAIELAALLLNVTLGAIDAGLFEPAAAIDAVSGTGAALAALAADMLAGKVDLLILAGVNPVYDAPAFATASAGLSPATFTFADALARVGYVVSMNDRLDETSRIADVLLPASHPFECWSDAALPRGLFAIQQPVIQPLFDTRGLLDTLVEWAAGAGDPAAQAAVAAAAAALAKPPVPVTAAPAASPNPAWHYLRAGWAARLPAAPATPAFEAAWNELLRAGQWPAPAAIPVTADKTKADKPAAKPGKVPAATVPAIAPRALALLGAIAPAGGTAAGLELQLYPHFALADGRSGNNGWLNELPDPITRITWGGALSIAPRRFDEMKLANGDLVEVDAGHAKIIAPAYRHAGMHYDQVALPLGLGRVACGVIGDGIGPNAFPLRILAGGRLVSAGLSVSIRKAAGNEPLALAQGSEVIDRDRRPIVPATTLSAYEKNRTSGTEQEEGGRSIWPVHEYAKTRWAMAIDLSKCNGCGKCVIGCQAENNIPVVGRAGMLDRRPMSWMRIDRYYDAPKKDGRWDVEVWDGPLAVVEEPQTLFEPMLCQHCENAPCETVCPFVATMHSADGLNQQVYNRCVGTRYCANNCPFKVRRFNFWEYGKKQESAFFRWLVPRIRRAADLNTRAPMQMKNNPEVTVRSRGVMEKCSFCIQRIRAAGAQATRDGKTKEHFPDGAVVPACMEACPTGAITFGDVNNPGSRVASMAAHPRAMRLLDAVGVKPSISYLTKVRHDKA